MPINVVSNAVQALLKEFLIAGIDLFHQLVGCGLLLNQGGVVNALLAAPPGKIISTPLPGLLSWGWWRTGIRASIETPFPRRFRDG